MKHKKKKNILFILLYISLIAIIFSILLINYYRNKLGTGLIKCAEDEVEKITTIVMNNCINKYITNNNIDNTLLNIKRKENNEIELISYNTKNVNLMTTTITKMLEDDLAHMIRGEFDKIDLNLKNISEDYYTKLNDGVIFYISTGSATGNSLLANLGPKIPLNLSLVENVSSNLNTKITEYGINKEIIEIYIKLKATTTINMPFMSKKIEVKRNIPITTEIIQGNIPNYYLGNNLQN